MRLATTGIVMVLVLALGISVRAQRASQADTRAAGMSAGERSAASELVAGANRDRAPESLQPLRDDAALARAAWRHAQRMVRSGTLSHQLPGEPDLIARVQQAGVHPSAVAENVAEAPTAAQINDEWMHSAPHRANLLDPRMNAIGVAVVKEHGELYAVEDFARETAALTEPQQERQVASLLRSHGLQVENNGAAARSYCSSGASRTRPYPKLVMRYSTTDLSRLPQQVEQGIRSGSYRRAVTAACSAINENGFSAYQIVILLY